MERRWIILITSGTIIMSTLIVGLLIHASFHKDSCKEDVCRTPECVQAAAHILDYIDIDMDPCENFYQFVCGNFIRTTEIPDDMKEISSDTILGDEILKQLRSILEDPVELNETRTFKTLKFFYQACSNTEAIERRGLKILRDLLKEVGGWPVLEDHNWEDKKLDWYYYIYKFRQLGLNTDHLLRLDVQNDFKNTTFHVLQISYPTFTLPPSFLTDEVQNEYVEEYRRYMTSVAIYLGALPFRATVDLRDALKFEMKLAKISLSADNGLNLTNAYNIMTVRDLQERYPSFHWLEYINNLIGPHYQVTSNERILVPIPEYIKDLEDLLKKTSKRDQINYLVWKAVSSIIPYVSDDLREMEFKFQGVMSGVTQRLPRWKECVKDTYKSFPIGLSALYANKIFDEDTKSHIEEITQNIKNEYVASFEKNNWMDKKTKKSALDKIEAMFHVIGFPDELVNDNKLEEVYAEVEVHTKEYLKSFLNITRNVENFKFKTLRYLKTDTAWMKHGHIAEVDALYTPLFNTITIPAGILQGSYFHRKHPNYLNYGAIGFAIGHEFSHAFDNIGRRFDKNGNMVNWWDENSEMLYEEETECIIDQYDSYNVSEIDETVDGSATLNDNIADNLGIKHAYSAYMKWEGENGEELKLPGLDYIPNQLFWISFALSRCAKQRPEHLELSLATEVHSPPEFRVIGSLRNSREFAYDFDCPDDSPMYPEDNCVVL